MILSDHTIKQAISEGKLAIDPFVPENVQPASVDLRLANKVLVFANSTTPYVDLKQNVGDLMKEVEIPTPEPFILHPNEFALGSTFESVTIGDEFVGKIEGKSSLGRVGLLIHSTAGFVDPGWSGRLTLELANVSRLPITLYSGMKIGQIAFHKLTHKADRPYGSEGLSNRYQGQQDAAASKIHIGFKADE